MRRISKTIMLNRLARLPQSASTKQVVETLKLDRSVLTRWQQDEEFLAAEVAVNHQTHWMWNKKKLTAWILAVMKLCESKGGYKPLSVRSNPPRVAMNPEEAAKALGIPKGYRVKR